MSMIMAVSTCVSKHEQLSFPLCICKTPWVSPFICSGTSVWSKPTDSSRNTSCWVFRCCIGKSVWIGQSVHQWMRFWVECLLDLIPWSNSNNSVNNSVITTVYKTVSATQYPYNGLCLPFHISFAIVPSIFLLYSNYSTSPQPRSFWEDLPPFFIHHKSVNSG